MQINYGQERGEGYFLPFTGGMTEFPFQDRVVFPAWGKLVSLLQK